MRYVISYDLTKPRQDYESLYEALEAMDAKPLLQSQWFVRQENTKARTLCDYFWEHMDSDDRLLVVPLDKSGWAANNLINKLVDL